MLVFFHFKNGLNVWERFRYLYCTFHLDSNVSRQIPRNVQSANAWWCNKKVAVWFCVCMEDNPLAEARGLTSRTDAQTIQCKEGKDQNR